MVAWLTVEFGATLNLEFHMNINLVILASLMVGASLLGGAGQQPFSTSSELAEHLRARVIPYNMGESERAVQLRPLPLKVND